MKYRVISPHGHAFDIDADAVDCALSSTSIDNGRRAFNLFWRGTKRNEENCVARVPAEWAILATGLRHYE